ncbi:hypothetical protein RQP46_001539 [Phenoliferia psychrophenolica]
MSACEEYEPQTLVDALVDEIQRSDALLSAFWLHEILRSDPALLYQSRLTALETAVVPVEFDEPPDVLARLQNAHRLVIQVLLLSGVDPDTMGQDGWTVAERSRARGYQVACAVLHEWETGDTGWNDARIVRMTLDVRDGLEDWLILLAYDRAEPTSSILTLELVDSTPRDFEMEEDKRDEPDNLEEGEVKDDPLRPHDFNCDSENTLEEHLDTSLIRSMTFEPAGRFGVAYILLDHEFDTPAFIEGLDGGSCKHVLFSGHWMKVQINPSYKVAQPEHPATGAPVWVLPPPRNGLITADCSTPVVDFGSLLRFLAFAHARVYQVEEV